MAQWLLVGRKGRRRTAGHEDLTGLAADRETRDGLSSAPSMTSAGTLNVAVSPRKCVAAIDFALTSIAFSSDASGNAGECPNFCV